MVSAKGKGKFGTEDYKFNAVDESEYGGGAAGNDFAPGGKERRGGVGGKGSKSHNFKENKNANKRRNEKKQREADKADAQAKADWMASEAKKYAPVDKHDMRHQKKMQ